MKKIFDDYDAFMAAMGLGVTKETKPKPSTFGKSVEETSLLGKELDKSSYKRDNYMQGYRKLILRMFENDSDLMKKHGFREIENMDLKNNYSKITKSEYANMVAKLFKNKEIYAYFLESLPSETKQVFECLIWKNELTDTEVMVETGVSIFTQTEKKGFGGKAYIERDFDKELMLLVNDVNSTYDYTTNSYTKVFTVEIPVELRRVLRDYYDKPLHYDFIPLNEAPKTTYVSNCESEIFINLPNLLSYNQQGDIKTSGSGKVMVSTLGKIRKSLNINELYPNSEVKELQSLKTYLLASLVTCESKPKKEETLVGILKNYIDKVYTKKFNSHASILTSLKGAHNIYNINDVESNFIEIVRQMPVDKWITIENVISFVTLRDYNFQISSVYEMCNYLSYEVEGQYSKEKKQLKKNDINKFVVEPILKGNMMLWACYGLLDIAYDDVDTSALGETYYSNYDGIKAVRLTNLGAYLLGKITEYNAPTVKQSYNMTFSTENLIILVEGETGITDNLLANYADKVGSNRYAVSNESFLKNVTNKKELKVKIDVFNQVINSNLPANWKAFFNMLDKKINPLTQLNEVTVFKIPSDDPELIKLLIQNQAIKKLLIKAEDYQIIVSKKDYPTLKTKLKAYGYLLN